MSALKDFQKKMNELGESVGFGGIETLLNCNDGIPRHRFDPDTAFDWRPPMRSHLHDDRAKRIIDLYFKNNEEFRRLRK